LFTFHIIDSGPKYPGSPCIYKFYQPIKLSNNSFTSKENIPYNY